MGSRFEPWGAVQDPYHFLAVKGTLDIAKLLGNRSAAACREVTQQLRRALATQMPSTCAVVCLLLSNILQESPAFGQVLPQHFRMIGPGLNRFYRCKDGVDYGGVRQSDLESVGECISHVLWQIEMCAGRSVRPLLQRYVPLYEGPL
jgi:hypothetical protein